MTGNPPTPAPQRAPGPWRHRNISAGGAQFHLVEAGPDTDDVVLLLHGFPEYWWAWRTQLPELGQAGYRTCAMDLRGFGASDRQPGGNELPVLTTDVIAVLRALGAKRAVVVGHGLGGAIAWAAPAAAPDLVVGVVAVAAPHPQAMRSLWQRIFTGSALDYLSLTVPLLPERGLRSGKLVRRLLRDWAAPANRELMAHQSATYTAAMQRPHAARAAMNVVRDHRRWSSEKRRLLATPVRVPVLSVQGEVDPLTPAQAHARDSHYVQGPLTQLTLRGTGHFCPEEAPEELTRALLQFLPTVLPLQHSARHW